MVRLAPVVPVQVILECIAVLVEGDIPQSNARECLEDAIFVNSRATLLKFVPRKVLEDFREQSLGEEPTQNTAGTILL